MATVPTDLSKLTNVVKNKVAKKTVYNELVKNIDNVKTTDTSDPLTKADFNKKFGEMEKKVLDHDHDNNLII